MTCVRATRTLVQPPARVRQEQIDAPAVRDEVLLQCLAGGISCFDIAQFSLEVAGEAIDHGTEPQIRLVAALDVVEDLAAFCRVDRADQNAALSRAEPRPDGAGGLRIEGCCDLF